MDFRSCFEHIQSSIPLALVDEKSKLNVLHYFPDFTSFSIASIECDLSSPAQNADIALGFEKELLPDHMLSWLPEEQTLLYSILNRNHFLNECVRGIWLNYDLSGGIATSPWTYLALYKMNLGQEFNVALLSQFLQTQLNEHRNTSFLHVLLNGLPLHAYIVGLSLKHERNHGSTRLVLYGMQGDEIVSYLQSVAWNGDAHMVGKMFTKFKFNARETGLILNIANDELGDSVGFELLLSDQSKDIIEYLLDELLTEQLILPAKHHALTQWCKPENTFKSVHGIRLWINHIKLTLSPQKSWSAKCYFGVQP